MIANTKISIDPGLPGAAAQPQGLSVFEADFSAIVGPREFPSFLRSAY